MQPAWSPRSRMMQDSMLVGRQAAAADNIKQPGIHGPKGEKGDPGSNGEHGRTGATGEKGDKGYQGDTGDKGSKVRNCKL